MKAIFARTLLGCTALTAMPSLAWAQAAQSSQGEALAPASAEAEAPASAQADGGDPVADAADPANANDVVVTGSRTGSGFNASTPTNVVNSLQLEQQGTTNIGQILNQVPGFQATTNPTTSGVRAPTAGSWTADLRALGAQRTLVLFDGMRVVPGVAASTRGAFPAPDLNQVPTLMVERVEVVTGGASAQWGSDAVSGVVNIILRKEYQGVQLSVQAGISERGDNENLRIGLLAGTSFAGGRGHIVVAADYVENSGMGDIYSRDWGREEYQIVPNSAFATNGLPANILAPNVHAPTTPGGVIAGPANFALRNFQFLPGGALAPFDVGTFQSANFMVGGEGRSLLQGITLSPELTRFTPYMRAQFELTSNLTVFVEGAYAWVEANQTLLPARDTATVIQRSNAFLPAAVATAMDAQGLTSFTMSRTMYDLGQTKVRIRNETPRFVIGMEGQLGGGWAWDAHYVWNRNDYLQTTDNNRIRARYAFAVDAVQSGGTVVCRATLPGPSFNAAAAGCVPINIFGDGSPSQAAIDYVTGSGRAEVRYLQQSAAANIRGEPFSTWAGPVSFAAGVEYRRETQRTTTDAIQATGGFEYANSTPLTGAFDVIEGYAEVIVPLVRDAPFVRQLDLNAAYRLADYSSSGTASTWKIGAVYEPVSGLRFRATYSRDLRAPAIFELSSLGTSGPAPVTVRGFSANISSNTSIGNPNLEPESGDTLTLGVVVQPDGIPGLRASVDYFNIDLSKAITQLAPANVAALCNDGQQAYCDAFTFAPSGAPTSLRLTLLNAASLQVIGYDFTLDYRRPLADIFSGARGTITLNFTGSYIAHLYSTLGIGSPRVDRAGENNQSNPFATPHLRANLSLTYTVDGFSITPRLSYVSRGTLDNTYNTAPSNTINNNRVPAVTYLDLYSVYDVSDNLQLTLGIRNLLDRDPPPIPSIGSYQAVNGAYYDVVGRQFQVGARVKF